MGVFLRNLIAICAFAGLLAACAPQSYYRSDRVGPTQGRTIVLMPLDVELGEKQGRRHR